MKFSKFSELVNRILSNNHSHRRDMDVTIVVHSPGSIGSTPSVEVQSIHAGFDWDSGKVLIFPAQPLTTLTPEQITDITDSVRKGQSWHAYQEYKKHKEQLEKLSIELDAAKQRIAELEGNCAALAAENAGIKSAIPESRDIEDDNDNMDDVSLAEDFGFNHAIERMRRQIPETPTTDAFLAEVRAQGLEMFAQKCNSKSEQSFASDIRDNWKLLGEHATDFAAELRKGGKQ
ncbi:TPA: ead/Ea22-like family protein [Escherichia coli]|nr:ead/Ea22-like family protein [Salmonella enterica]EBF6938585.1 ead/Ea22-like family protein [Salmonella enterica subsp. enterica serovar Concord]EDA5499576.1 ead/Ea22-like family protein [Salmonella enterica subsp. enterica serovar Montevideo]EET1661054.1 ead/Ea22-like family protein [Escherichia coli]EBF7064098.1 ead/Ea22-like family protein [Salmonella enterica subsp. enterica serovar Concord]